MKYFLIACFSLFIFFDTAFSQSRGWVKNDTDYAAHWVHPDKSYSAYILLLQEVDLITGSSVNTLGYSNPKDALTAALSAAPFQIRSLEVQDYSKEKAPFVTGILQTNTGEKSFAATLAYRPPNRRLIMRIGPLEELASLSPSYVGTLQNFPSRYPEADLPGGVVTLVPPKLKVIQSKASPKKLQNTTEVQNSGMSSGASALLAGVRGDLKNMEEKSAKQRAAKKALADKERARAKAAKLKALYLDSGARPGYYPAPSQNEVFLAWPVSKIWGVGVQVPGDLSSPRVATRTYDSGPSQALREFKRDTGLKVKGTSTFTPLEAYKNLDGRDVQILLTETELNGQAGIAFVFYARGKKSAQGSLRVIEMPAITYADWGGVASMLTMRGVVQNVDVFPKQQRRRIARDSLKEQTALYVAILDKFYQENTLAMMMTQAQTTAMMTELNYDLLFGNDITPGPWGD